MDNQQQLRQQLLNYLSARHAHAGFGDAISGLPVRLINQKLPNVPYSFWQLLEHMRITQNDIVDFIRNPGYKYKPWPKDYWPDGKQKADGKMWVKAVAQYKKDFADLNKIVSNPKTDLLAKIPHGEGQTILREVMLTIDHNAYHIGEFILLRRALKIWKS